VCRHSVELCSTWREGKWLVLLRSLAEVQPSSRHPSALRFSDYFIFQQDNAPAHRARDTVEMLKKEAPDFIPPTFLVGDAGKGLQTPRQGHE